MISLTQWRRLQGSGDSVLPPPCPLAKSSKLLSLSSRRLPNQCQEIIRARVKLLNKQSEISNLPPNPICMKSISFPIADLMLFNSLLITTQLDAFSSHVWLQCAGLDVELLLNGEECWKIDYTQFGKLPHINPH